MSRFTTLALVASVFFLMRTVMAYARWKKSRTHIDRVDVVVMMLLLMNAVAILVNVPKPVSAVLLGCAALGVFYWTYLKYQLIARRGR